MSLTLGRRLRYAAHRLTVNFVRIYYNKVYKTQIGEGSRISRSAYVDKTNPRGVVIGKYTAMAFGSGILTHDFVNNQHLTTTIGDYCFIGAKAMIMPGVTIGDHCIIGTGAVVMKNVPAGSVVTGNPGRVMERGITTGKFGIRLETNDDPSIRPV